MGFGRILFFYLQWCYLHLVKMLLEAACFWTVESNWCRCNGFANVINFMFCTFYRQNFICMSFNYQSHDFDNIPVTYAHICTYRIECVCSECVCIHECTRIINRFLMTSYLSPNNSTCGLLFCILCVAVIFLLHILVHCTYHGVLLVPDLHVVSNVVK